jgi:two-component system phosphate regulon sensor histidine kinase PhoR
METSRRKAPFQRSGEVQWLDDQQHSRWFAIACRSLNLDERQPASANKGGGALAVLRDVTDLKSGQRRYAEFVSSVSHEMKSPLTGIKAYVELLADGEAEEPETRDEFLRVIQLQADRLQRLIDNLLNLARIEAGVMNVTKVPVSLNELLAETLDVIRPAAEAKQIAVAAEFSPLYLGVLADRDMLIQVAINLLSNAVKYTRDGLSPEDQLKVFEKFYRVQKDRDMAGGTGLGLPLAKHIVEDVHGGRVTVRSTPGAGSVFTVALPTKATREAARMPASNPPSPPVTAPSLVASP